MTEKTLTKNIKKWLSQNGWFHVKIHGGMMQVSGLPDILALKKGRYVWIEVKTPDGTTSERQKHMQHTLRSNGAMVMTVKSIEHLKAWLGPEAAQQPDAH